MPSTCCAAGRQTVVRRADLGAGDLDHADGDGEIKAPMHGKVLALLVGNGEQVEKGQRLAIIEAMKMEHTLTAPRAGRVAGIAVSAGSQVAEGARLMTIEHRGLTDMPLHLIKLSVGTDSIEDLEDWIKLKFAEQKKRGVKKPERFHTTRMVPKRAEEILDGGSIYWVIRGEILCRERILDIRPFVGQGGRRPLPAHSRSEMRAGAAAAVSRIPGLALSRREGCAARSRPRCARHVEHARAVAARIAGTGAALNPDIVDQPGAAELCRHQQPHRAIRDASRSAPASRRGAPQDSPPQSPRARFALRLRPVSQRGIGRS